MKAICRITRYSSLAIPPYVQVTRLWRAYFKLCETLLGQQQDVMKYIEMHNADDLLRNRKDKEGKKVTDQVSFPNWSHMSQLRDFLSVFVKLLDRLESHEAPLYEQFITAQVIEDLDSNDYTLPGFPDVKKLVDSMKSGYKNKFLDGCINTTAMFCFAMIPSKTTAFRLKNDKKLKANVTAYVTQWITFHVADDVVKQRDQTQKEFGLTAPKKKRTKADEAALKNQIISSKTTDYLQKIELHMNSILSNPNPPVPELKFNSNLISVSNLATKFAEFWNSHKDAELADMVFKSASGLPASTLSEQAFSKLDFQSTENQSVETLEKRTMLQYAHLNGMKFDMTKIDEIDL